MGHEHHETPSFWRSRAGLALLVACAVIGFYLLTKHTAHLLGAPPFLLFLACLLMHVFMHSGGGHHHGSTRSTNDEQRRQ
ncbi:DUF2933 domain-containing protein [Cupriavidus sp. H39]|uniref:DUF2933 domain-containing protein n=1 Tax=Cupriavidus sp. H39 TaxID=3401635 RepID=UPI003D0773F8